MNNIFQCPHINECTRDKVIQEREFFASMVHEIRTPMNAILGFLELLELEVEDTNQKDYLRSAHKSGELISLLVNDILDISKIEAGEMQIDKHLFVPLELFEEITKLFYYTTQKKGIFFTSYFDPKIPYMIHSDPYRLKQIINNLMSNAIKFTSDGGRVSLSFDYNEAEDSLKISISDTGIGISKEGVKNIFSRYKQASKTTSSDYGGTGLGLSISEQLARLLGGNIAVKSIEKEGSIFAVTLPTHSIDTMTPTIDSEDFENIHLVFIEASKSFQEHQYMLKGMHKYCKRLSVDYSIIHENDIQILKQERFKASICIIDSSTICEGNKASMEEVMVLFEKKVILLESKALLSSFKFDNIPLVERPLLAYKTFDMIINIAEGRDFFVGKETLSIVTPSKILNILLVDDNYINLKLMSEVVKKFHHNAFIAKDGVEAIEVYKNARIDIVFIDYEMPKMNGIESIKEMKKIAKEEDTVFYGLTGYEDIALLKAFTDAGAVDVLSKPIAVADLVRLF